MYLARAATAHLDAGDIDQACTVGHHALDRASTVESTRPTAALRELAIRLSTEHANHRSVHAFLDQQNNTTSTRPPTPSTP